MTLNILLINKVIILSSHTVCCLFFFCETATCLVQRTTEEVGRRILVYRLLCINQITLAYFVCYSKSYFWWFSARNRWYNWSNVSFYSYSIERELRYGYYKNILKISRHNSCDLWGISMLSGVLNQRLMFVEETVKIPGTSLPTNNPWNEKNQH